MSKFMKNLDKNFFGNGDTLLCEDNFETWIPKFSGSDSLEMILRTNLTYESISQFLSSIFSRIYSLDISKVKTATYKLDSERSLYCSRINLYFLKPHFWSYLEKDFINFYSLHLIKLLDWELCPPDTLVAQEYWQDTIRNFEEYFRDIIHTRINSVILCSVFFHPGILSYLKVSGENGLSISANSIVEDFRGINRIMRTPYKLKDAISSCDFPEQGHISDQIIKEYIKMRRNW